MSEEDNLYNTRHSLAHLLAIAVSEKYPGAKLAIGTPISEGFYYDFDLEGADLSENHLPEIEKRVKELIKENKDFLHSEVSVQKAREMFSNQPYKLEIIDEIAEAGEEEISIYTFGEYTEPCRGGHVGNSSEIDSEAFQLTAVAGAYWRGDENNKMLTRVYGLAFESKKELEEYIENKKEAEKRDHRLLGQKLELFMFDDEVGQGLPLWLPKGAFVRHKIMEYAFNTYLERGYQPVASPHIASEKLWSHSGHLDFYGDSMYDSFGIENEQYRLKPMNCPFHVKMYNIRPRSYRELPMRLTEMGTVYRYERSGTLHGLTRVRGFTQDDAHIICTFDQLYGEIVEVLKLTLEVLKTFGFHNFEMNLSVRDPNQKEKYIGEDSGWKHAEEILKKALEEAGFEDYNLDEGEAVFYGPKIDIKVSDSLERKWQTSTIQVDFNLPGRFKMEYIDKDGQRRTPFMLHRALLGSLERFMGVYIEHCGGNFPLWLAPLQVKMLPIGESHQEYAREAEKKLRENGLRVEIDQSDNKLNKKVMQAKQERVPYFAVIGDSEVSENKIKLESRDEGDIGKFDAEELIIYLKQKEQNKE